MYELSLYNCLEYKLSIFVNCHLQVTISLTSTTVDTKVKSLKK